MAEILNPIEIQFDASRVGLADTQGGGPGWLYMDWEQAADLCRRLDIVLRYHGMYMQAD